ncbi:aspartate aminotransferase family protein [Alkalisalibacterium limincola]|uniref:Aspartate aminotransferase family protein n=1 Tax=Alkalisalibacterium limincola TaxID=2699169 RepID=A0A5C8KJ66_9GAMM|nr:aspartate aminotransferase family protein [Alkalisalibacterium limincola]
MGGQGGGSFRDALDAAYTLAIRHLDGIGDQRVAHLPAPEAPAPPDGIGFDAALKLANERIVPWISASPGPRYLGYVTGGVTPEALAADWLVSTWDQNVSNAAGSIAADVERRTVAAFGAAFGLASSMHGQFVSGATAANLVCIATAREWAARQSSAPLTVFAGSAHSSILKAMSITGVGRSRLRPVATLAGRTAVDPLALEQALAIHSGGPAVVVASAGEVNTGDFDDLLRVSEICKRHRAWLHVDGAFGLFAAFDSGLRPRLDGIEHADSVTVDLHKWLNVPYDSAIAYTARPDLQREVFSASSAYLGDDPDPLHFTPENSRRFRAFPAWMVLATRGTRGIGEWVGANCRLARQFGEAISATGRFQVLGGIPLNIVSFTPTRGGATARDRFLQRLNAGGETFMTPGQLFGQPTVRAAFSNWTTSAQDLDRIVAAVAASVD